MQLLRPKDDRQSIIVKPGVKFCSYPPIPHHHTPPHPTFFLGSAKATILGCLFIPLLPVSKFFSLSNRWCNFRGSKGCLSTCRLSNAGSSWRKYPRGASLSGCRLLIAKLLFTQVFHFAQALCFFDHCPPTQHGLSCLYTRVVAGLSLTLVCVCVLGGGG